MPDPATPSLPATVRIAAVLVVIEALAIIGYAALQLSDVGEGQGPLAAGTGLFFGVYGGGLLLAARGLWHRMNWARGWVLATQLIQLGLAWNLRSEPTTPIAVVLAVLALMTLAAMVSRSATAVFTE